MNPVHKILYDKSKDRESIIDLYGKLILVGDHIIDENGNIGKVLRITGDTAIVDFGKKIGHDAVHSGDKIKKGKKW
jgi:hypothetical protein